MQSISADGNIGFYQGCFTDYSHDLNVMLAARCRAYQTTERALSPNEWVDRKRQILMANPLQIKSTGCDTSGVQCNSDYDSRSVIITVDGNSNVVSWPGGASGLATNLQSIIDMLTTLGFYL